MVANELLLDIALLDLDDLNGDIANVELVVGWLKKGVVKANGDLLLLGLVAESLRGEGGCLSTEVPIIMLPKLSRHSSTERFWSSS